MPRAYSLQQMMGAFNGTLHFKGTLTSAASAVTNASTAVPFTLAAGSILLVQPDGDGYLLPGGYVPDGTAQPTVDATNGVKIVADSLFIVTLGEATTLLQWFATLSANLKVWRLR